MASTFETCVDEIHTELGDATVVKNLHRISLDKTDIPNRVTWIPVGGRIESTTTTTQKGPAGALIAGTARVVPLSSKKLTVLAHIVASSFENLETLHNNVLVAVDAAMQKASIAGTFNVTSESDARFGNVAGGISVIVQSFEWDLVVAKQIQTLAVATAQEHECTLGPAETELE